MDPNEFSLFLDLFEAKANHKLIYTALLLGVNSYALQDGSVDYICSDTANMGIQNQEEVLLTIRPSCSSD